ncbi:glutaredoxin family protein [Psychrobacter sp. AOP22-C1-C5]|uniref:glutaredoxin family protein n=1 Tax=Psychrobacter sp. AOP22-C1-C5 TaxID=3457716 RepID=UPI0040367FDE
MHDNATHKSHTQNNSIEALRARMAAENPHLDICQSLDKWWLLGTSGCHLCDIAEQILSQFQAVQPIAYEHVDIADFDESLMMEFATTIPVILTPTKRLNYPFSVMDLQGLLTP